MKIMSYIQKTIYALFLLALFSGCTDEVLDGGGGTNVPTIEDGTLVNVGIALDGSMAKTVVTRSMDDDDKPEVDDDLVILQYKDGNLIHAWYTDAEFKNGRGDYNKLDGWGEQTPVKNIQLLSGSDYQIFVVANLDLDSKSPLYQISLKEHPGLTGKDLDDQNGSIDLENSTSFYHAFASIDALLSWQHENSIPDDDDIMLAIVNNGAMTDEDNLVYRYTKMLTTSKETLINDVVTEAPKVTITGSTEDDKLCATLYQPYAQISLTIQSTDHLQSDVTIKSVKIKNCPTTYKLVNGYSLGEGSKTEVAYFSRDDDDDDDDNDGFDYKEYNENDDCYNGVKFKARESRIFTPRNDDEKPASVFVYENMAGILPEGMSKVNPNGTGDNKMDDVTKYTYIEVNAQIGESEKDITYRFILGKNRKKDCNVERNVHYNVTMTLTGDGGVNNTTWEVIYEGTKPDDKPVVDGGNVLSRLDAHASVKEFTIKNMKEGAYFYVVVNKDPESSRIDIDANSANSVTANGGYTYNSYAGGFNELLFSNDQIALYKKGDSEFYKVKISKDGNYTFKYRQLSWFDYSKVKNGMFIGEANKYNIATPSTVATATPNTYYLHIYEGNESSIGILVETIKVTQYPPIVVNYAPGVSQDDNFEDYTVQGTYAYMERFDDDHSGLKGGKEWDNADGLGKGWTIIEDSDKAYKKQMFDYEDHSTHPNYMNSDYCYWANLHGPYKFTQNPFRQNEDWDYNVDSQNDELRYIIPWSK